MKVLTGNANTKDWLEASKDIKIRAYIPTPREDYAKSYGKEDFIGDLKKASRPNSYRHNE